MAFRNTISAMKIRNGLDHSQGIEQNKRKVNWLYQNCLKTAAMCDYSSNIWSVTMAMQVKSYNRHSRMFAHHEATYEVWGQQLQLMVAYYYYQLCTRNLPQLLRYAYCTQVPRLLPTFCCILYPVVCVAQRVVVPCCLCSMWQKLDRSLGTRLFLRNEWKLLRE